MHNKLSIIFYIISILGLVSCDKKQADIDVICEQTENDDFIIRWDIYPSNLNAQIEIFGSTTNESNIPQTSITITSSEKYIVKIQKLSDSTNYRFFQLRAGDLSSLPFSSRYISFENILNFRDIGGYKNRNGEEIKWRKIYRSGDLSNRTPQDLIRLNNLSINTIIDLDLHPDKREAKDIKSKNFYNIPISILSQEELSSLILQQYFTYDDAKIYIQELYLDMALKNKDNIAFIMDILLDKNNYPILITGEQGKDQTGFIVYTLMKILDVYPDVAEDDYLLSNIGIDKDKLFQKYKTLPLSEQQQLALSLLGKTETSNLKYTSTAIRKEYGSFDSYIEEGLNVTPEKKAKLRSLLLTSKN